MSEIVVKQDTLKSIIRSDEVKGRFAEVVGNTNAAGYISSVLLAVAESPSLSQCSPLSIISAALRAATMRLSVEPSTGQAYLVPFKGKATLVVGWRGIYHMALRTGKYRFINLVKVYEGETVIEDRLTGINTLTGAKTSDKVIGYMLYFQLVNGFQKTFYMSTAECAEHGQHYSKNYNSDGSLWKTDPQAMYKKTVMRLGLLRWGYLEPSDLQTMNQVDENEELGSVVDAVAREVEDEPVQKISVVQAMSDLGFDEPKQVTREQVKAVADKKGVDPRGLDELYDKHNGDVNAVMNQLSML